MFAVNRYQGSAPDSAATDVSASKRRSSKKQSADTEAVDVEQPAPSVADADTVAATDKTALLPHIARKLREKEQRKAEKKAVKQAVKQTESEAGATGAHEAAAAQTVASTETPSADAAPLVVPAGLSARAAKKLQSLKSESQSDSDALAALQAAEAAKQQRKADKTSLKRSRQLRRAQELQAENALKPVKEKKAKLTKIEAVQKAFEQQPSVLPGLVNTTKRSVDPAAALTAVVAADLTLQLPSSVTATSVVSKGQKPKDPNERLTERRERKRARMIQAALDAGLPEPTFSDEDEIMPPVPKQSIDALSLIKSVTDATEADLKASMSTRALPLTSATDAAQEAKLQRQLALASAQPQWMQRGTVIDNKDANTPVEQLIQLSESVRYTLTQVLDIHSLFPMQCYALQSILATHETNDVCLQQNTGSGKSLCYILPVVHSLCTRTVRRLRCLVLVPTRDLALQVHSIFAAFALHSKNGLRVGCAIGQHSFAQEQSDFVCAGESGIDVLVATPGRLVDHLTQTPGFTLSFVEWLVFDEVDRLMHQNYQTWMTSLDSALRSPVTSQGVRSNPQRRVQKLLFSATLSTDPGKLAQLSLHHPLFISSSLSASTPYALPASLSQHLIACEASEKPLLLLWLLSKRRLQTQMNKVIVFAASLESTHRLTRLLQLYFKPLEIETGRVTVHEFSSLITQHARTKLLAKFKTSNSENGCQVLVCSDAFSRGLDVPFVDTVVSHNAMHAMQMLARC